MMAIRFAAVLVCLAVSSTSFAQVAPPNDNCATPLALSGPGLHPLDTSFATTGSQGQNESQCKYFGWTMIARDVWFTYASTTTGLCQVTTCGLVPVTGQSTNDSKIAVYLGEGCPTDGTAVACNDDDASHCGTGLFGSFESTLVFATTCGATYAIQIGHYAGPGPLLPLVGQFRIQESGLAACAGTLYCAGDGSSGPCPCGNENAAALVQGCRNSSGSGARLVALGNASVAADTVVLNLSNLPIPPTLPTSVLYFQGTAQASAPFADGRLCAGGSVVRLAIQQYVGAFGNYPGPQDARVSTRGLVPAGGGTRHYQAWYRDAPGPCGTRSNLTNGVTISWVP